MKILTKKIVILATSIAMVGYNRQTVTITTGTITVN